MDSAGSSGIERTSSEESEVRTSEFQKSDLYGDEGFPFVAPLRDPPAMSPGHAPFAFPAAPSAPAAVHSSSRSPVAPPSPSLQSVNTIADLLKRLQVAETTTPSSAATQLTDLVLAEISSLQHRTLSAVPGRFRARLLQNLRDGPVPAPPSGDDLFPFLFGRCFNLSLNLKILGQGSAADPNIVSRVLSDLNVLEKSLLQRLRTRKDADANSDPAQGVSALMTGLRLGPAPKVGSGANRKNRPKLMSLS